MYHIVFFFFFFFCMHAPSPPLIRLVRDIHINQTSCVGCVKGFQCFPWYQHDGMMKWKYDVSLYTEFIYYHNAIGYTIFDYMQLTMCWIYYIQTAVNVCYYSYFSFFLFTSISFFLYCVLCFHMIHVRTNIVMINVYIMYFWAYSMIVHCIIITVI